MFLFSCSFSTNILKRRGGGGEGGRRRWNKKVILGTATVSDSEINGPEEMMHTVVSRFQQQILDLVYHPYCCFFPPVPSSKSIMENQHLHHSWGLPGVKLDGSI